MFSEKRVTGGDGPLNLAVGPKTGPPILFLHGVGRLWRDFAGLMTALAPRRQVLALDFRGHGHSARTAGKYLVRDYVRDAVAVLRSIGRPVYVYGHSLGSMVAAAAAAEVPELVRGVVLEDPPFETTGPAIVDGPFLELFRLLQTVSGSQASVRELARHLANQRVSVAGRPEGALLGELRDATSIRFGAACLKLVDPAVWDPVLAGRWLEGYDVPRVLASIKCPTLVLQGDVADGGMVSEEAGRRVEQQIAECLRIRIPRASHLIHNLEAELTLRLVTEFLESIALETADGRHDV
jgi:pimeloyl-ACP methyl ester carboxylesterase